MNAEKLNEYKDMKVIEVESPCSYNNEYCTKVYHVINSGILQGEKQSNNL